MKLYIPKKYKKYPRVGKYGIQIEGKGKGKYDIRNPLNDLTGKEWTYFLNSVEVTAFPVTGPESYGHKLRKRHPSPKPPQLMKKLIEFFTRENQWVLDPFAGVGGTLLGCSLAGRKGIGIDLSKKYLNIYKKVCKQEGLKEQITIPGDARDMVDFPEIEKHKFDLILTDPPYCHMMKRVQSGEKKKKTGSSAPTPFTSQARDIGNLDYQSFLLALREIIEIAIKFLRNKKYVIIFTKDLQPTKKHLNILHADIITELSKIKNLSFKGYKIWYNKTVNLYPFGYPFSYVSNQLHQFILIFRKEQ